MQTTFPNVIVVDRRKYNLQNRRKCLECLPFKSFDRYSRKDTEKTTERVCAWRACQEKYKASLHFQEGSGTYCSRTCRSAAAVARMRIDRKQRAVEHLGGACSTCGYSKSLAALHFHHLRDKTLNLNQSMTMAWDNIRSEIEKCILLCANCHAEKHSKEFDIGD